MTRMIEEQRQQIGTLKALGYSDGVIAFKYFAYAMLSTVSDALAGDSGECSLHRRGDDRGMLQRTRRRSGRADAAGSTEKRQTDFPGTHRRTLETSELYAEINRAESGAV